MPVRANARVAAAVSHELEFSITDLIAEAQRGDAAAFERARAILQRSPIPSDTALLESLR